MATGEHPIFARIYDRALKSVEEGGLAERRRKLLAEASGRTLDLGAGTGANLPHYPEAVTELVLAEPDPHMAKRLRAHVEAERPDIPVEVIEAPAEDLPFDDASFETVVSTLVLCTVEDPAQALAEVKRVLDEDGAFVFIEHVRSDRPRLARVQDLLERPWGFFAGGCHPNRRTGDAVADAGLWIERLDKGELDKMAFVAKPLITGVARKPSGAAASDY